MTLAPIQREKIYRALLAHRKNFGGTQREFCKIFDINEGAFSQLKTAMGKGNVPDKLIADDKLVRIGRKLQVSFSSVPVPEIAKTEVYEYLYELMEMCRTHSAGRLFVDRPDIGKSAVAKEYMLNHDNVFYIDCGQCKGLTEFVRAVAKAVGASSIGSMKDVYTDTVYVLQSMNKPLIILDEAGDLSYTATLHIKAFWNALEGACGWLMMGADGLAKKMDTNIANKKVGYAEILRRFGGEYLSLTKGMTAVELVLFKKKLVEDILYANMPKGTDLKELIKDTTSPTRALERLRARTDLHKKAA